MMRRLLVVLGLMFADRGSWNASRGLWVPAAAQAIPDRAATERALAAERARIDAVDTRIVSLLNERAKIVQQIGRIKRKSGMPVAAPGRVEEVFRKVAGHNTGPLSAAAVRRIYERIIEEMTALELKTGS